MKLLLTLSILLGFGQLNALSEKPFVEEILYVIQYDEQSIEISGDENILAEMNQEMIASMNVIKKSSGKLFEPYENRNLEGVIIITLKSTSEAFAFFEGLAKRDDATLKIIQKEDLGKEVKVRFNESSFANILLEIQIDGQTFILNDQQKFLSEIDPNDIESINVIKTQEELKAYAAEDKDGLIKVTLKLNKDTKKLLKKLKEAKNN